MITHNLPRRLRQTLGVSSMGTANLTPLGFSQFCNVSRLIEYARQARPGALDQLLTAYLNYLRLLAILRLRTPAESTSRSMGY
jgi:hypothetical protein